MREHHRSESPTPATGIPTLLRSPSPRLLSASSRGGNTRPSWLKVPRKGRGNPLVRNPLGRCPKRPSSPLPPSSPPGSSQATPPRSHKTQCSHSPSPFSDAFESFTVPISDAPNPLKRARPPTPHPRSSSSLLSTQHGTQWHQTGLNEDEDADTLPPDSPSSALKSAEEAIEMPRASSIRWSPLGGGRDDSFFVADAPLSFEDLLGGSPKFDMGEMSELDCSPARRSRPPQKRPRSLRPASSRRGNAHTSGRQSSAGDQSLDKASYNVLDKQAWQNRRNHAGHVEDRDPWGFYAIRGHVPYQFNGCPSSEDRRQHRRQRRQVRSASPIEFSSSPSPPSPQSGDRGDHARHASSSRHVPSRFTPPPLPNRRNVWRGKRVLDAYLAGDRRWPAPGGHRECEGTDSSGDEDAETSGSAQRSKPSRKRRGNGTKPRKSSPTAGSVPAAGPERSPSAAAARQARIRFFDDLAANYKLDVEYVLG